MKANKQFSTLVKSAATVLVFGGFIWLLLASEEFPPTKGKYLANGKYEETVETTYNLTTFTTITTGKLNAKSFWDGEVTEKEYRTMLDGPREETSSTAGNYVDGDKDGIWTVTYPTGRIVYIVYDHGKETIRYMSPKSGLTGESAFDLLLAKHFLFLNSLELFGLTNDKIKVYADSLEAGLGRQEFDQAGFESAYSNVRADLDEYPPFDSISGCVAYIAHYKGMYRIKKHDLRMAVLDRNRDGTGTTYAVVDSKYHSYLAFMNEKTVTDAEFEVFCHEIDSTMDTYGPLDRNDLFFVDSVDRRFYRALSAIGLASSSFGQLISATVNTGNLSHKEIREKAGEILWGIKELKTSGDRAMSVYGADVYTMYLESDEVKVAVRDAWFARKLWVQLPVVTTGYTGPNSQSSVTLRGNVIESGGADVTARGITWAGTYNPTVADHMVNAGSGNGIFEVAIDGLEPGKTYYARTYATNSAGTAYGNVIEFTTARTASVPSAGSQERPLGVYPNPTAGRVSLNYQVEIPGNYVITIMNVAGQTVYSDKTMHDVPGEFVRMIDLSEFPDGIYHCRISGGLTQSVSKIIKSR